MIIPNTFLHQEKLPLSAQLCDNLSCLLTSEQSTYAPKRKMEYLAGRLCAINALKQLGLNEIKIPMHTDRSPQWPEGIVGSITHTKTLAMAAVSKHWQYLGLDAEVLMNQQRYHNIKKMIVNQKEIKMIEANIKIYPTLVFSAKESLYKALYPICKQYFGFLEASIIDISDNQFTIELHSQQPKLLDLNGVYHGQYEQIDETLVTCIYPN